MKKLLHPVAKEGGPTLGYMFWCPACENGHVFWTATCEASGGHPQWSFDGNLLCPTFGPSLRAYRDENGAEKTICHLFVRQGKIEYCGDCPHKLAGQTVPMEPFPEGD